MSKNKGIKILSVVLTVMISFNMGFLAVFAADDRGSGEEQGELITPLIENLGINEVILGREGFEESNIVEMVYAPSKFEMMDDILGEEFALADLLGYSVVIRQDDKENGIGENGDVDPTQPFQIDIAFKVPVLGAETTPDPYIQAGEYVTFTLDDDLELICELDKSNLTGSNGIIYGTVNTSGKIVTVQFNERVEDNDLMELEVSVVLEVRYVGILNPTDPSENFFTVLGKTFMLKVPERKKTLAIEKSGQEDLNERVINWQLKVVAEDVFGKSLKGCIVSDYLDPDSVGVYVYDSFKIGPSNNINEAFKVEPDYDNDKLVYKFEDDSDGPCYLFFQTEIPDHKYFTTSKQSLTNQAQIEWEGETDRDAATITFTPHWISKSSIVDQYHNKNEYKVDGRTITWIIEVNQMEQTLQDAYIIDKLDDGLKWSWAKLEKWNRQNGDWEEQVKFPLEPSDSKYTLGNIEEKWRLLIGCELKDNMMPTTASSYKNTAQLGWKDSRILSAVNTAQVGFWPIGKQSGAYDCALHTVQWSVTMDTKKLEYSSNTGDWRIMDLLVYEDGQNFTDSLTAGMHYRLEIAEHNHVNAPSQDGGGLVGSDIGKILQELTPNEYQKFHSYDTGPAMNDKRFYAVYRVKDSNDEAVADLLIFSGIEWETSNAWVYKSQLTDPAQYAKNVAGKDIKNTAVLFEKEKKINLASAQKYIYSQMAEKKLMTRDGSKALLSSLERNDFIGALHAINHQFSENAALGFDYEDQSVIFRIQINSNGLNAEELGAFELTDTLPVGWEFTPINGEKFLIYEGERNKKDEPRLYATAPVTDPVSLNNFMEEWLPATSVAGESLKLTFEPLNRSYILLVKARPTNTQAKIYFSNNATWYPLNNVELYNEVAGKCSDSQQVMIVSKVLDKQIDSSMAEQEAYLIWTVEYNPFELDLGYTHMIDKLPLGIELRRTPGSAELKYVEEDDTKLIAIYKTRLKADGTYELLNDQHGQPEELALPDNNILTYNHELRELRFNIPSASPTQSYRLVYVTDINTNQVGAQINNTVTLYGVKDLEVETGAAYEVPKIRTEVIEKRGGWLKITKVNGDNSEERLREARFTLYAEPGRDIVREGTTNDMGIISFRAIPAGIYTLRETQAPPGYNAEEYSYKVTVEQGADGKLITKIDGLSNEITVENFARAELGSLTISKQVAGNAASTSMDFSFIVKFYQGPDEAANFQREYHYIKYDENGNEINRGVISSNDTVSLSHGQSICIEGIPAGTYYEVIEEDYALHGYTTVSSRAKGWMGNQENIQPEAVFINTRHSPDGGGDHNPDPPLITTEKEKIPPEDKQLPEVPRENEKTPVEPVENEETLLENKPGPLKVLAIPLTNDSFPLKLLLIGVVLFISGAGLLHYIKRQYFLK